MNIKQVIDNIIKAEGGYVNNANDKGGETNYGITIAVARDNGYKGPMRDMNEAFARSVYEKQYIIKPGFDKIAVISQTIAGELADTGVNMGPNTAGKFLQRALNVLNNQSVDFPDLTVDGECGAKTREALSAFIKKRGAIGEKRLLSLLNCLQGERYVSLCEARKANETFMYGWLARIEL